MKTTAITLPRLAAIVSTDADGRVNLTDLWKAAGSPYQQRPAAWFSTEAATKYLAATAKKLKVAKNDLLQTRAGRGGGSYGNKFIALEYARYLNADLAVAVNEVFFERIAEEKNPELIVDRAINIFRRKGLSDAQIGARIQGIQARNLLTETAGRHGVRGEGFRDITNAVYMPVLGGTAAEIRKREHLPEKANIRDSRSVLQLRAIEFAELLATENIEQKRVFGNEACVNECYRAGVEVRNAVMRSRGQQSRVSS
jgi:hypothetical protein